MRTSWFTMAAWVVATLFSGVSVAQTTQPWLGQDRESGIGVRVGNLELHPGIASEVGYDSNYFQSSGSDPANNVSEAIVPSLQFRVTPSLTLKTLGDRRKPQDGQVAAPPKLNFRSRLSARVGGLYGLSSEESVDRFTLGANLGANLDILPERPWGAGIAVGFSRQEQPNSNPANVQSAFDRNGARGSFDIKWRPGGGLLEWKLGYDARLTVYDNSALGLNQIAHGVRTRGRWKFLPRTALLYEGRVGFVTHTQDGTRQRDAQPIYSQIGVNGLVTPRLGLLLLGGWKGLFYEEDPAGDVDDFDGPIGRAELTWYLAARDSTWRFGYKRDAANSGVANYYELNRFYTDLTHSIGRSWRVAVRVGLSLVSHPTPLDAAGNALTTDGGGLNEWRPDGSIFLEYKVASTIAVFSNTGFSASPADNFLQVPGTAAARENLKYFRFTTFLGARWFM